MRDQWQCRVTVVWLKLPTLDFGRCYLLHVLHIYLLLLDLLIELQHQAMEGSVSRQKICKNKCEAEETSTAWHAPRRRDREV